MSSLPLPDFRLLFESAPDLYLVLTPALGLGIPAAYQHKIFQAFQRVWVESEPGEGSTFFVALPLAPPDEPALRAGTGQTTLLQQTGDR
jgi:signal transduction histidine kinase